MKDKSIKVHRVVLHIEVPRYCRFADCTAKSNIGLTKEEAINYHGFECDQCKRWNEDILYEGDAPDWWPEISQGETSN